MSDPFDRDAPQTKPLRGSDNQRLFCLTPLGESLFSSYERCIVDTDKQLVVMFDEDGTVWLAGIPRKGDITRLAALLAAQGHSFQTTEAP